MTDIELGMQLEDMIHSDAWAHVEEWIRYKEERAKKDLATKNFIDISEVKVLQERLKAFSELRGEITDRIRRGKEAKQKLEAKGQV